MKIETMQDIKTTMSDLLHYVGEVYSFTDALSSSLEVTQSHRGSKVLFRMQIKGTKYLQLLQDGITVAEGSVLPAGTYWIGPSKIQMVRGALHATGSLYFDGSDLQECITEIELVACSSPGDEYTGACPSYRQFLALYAKAEQARLQEMVQ